MKKWSDRLFLLVIAAVLFAVPVASAALFLTRGDGISYYENRTLTARPTYTEESFWDGSYFSGWEDWYSDRVAGRETLMSWHTALEMNMLRRPVVNDIIVGDEVLLQVNSQARRRAAANHSAIHVINAALRQVFGDGVHQSGSYVSPQRLRFDYTLSKTPTAEEWKKVWAIVQQAIDAALPVTCQERPLKDAAKLGAVTLLGETYADPARFVLMGGSFEEPEKKYSLELCAGTHVSNTAQIITVVPIKEGSLSAGVRRIEAVAGPSALDYLKGINAEMEEMAARLTVPVADVAQRLHALMDELREVKKRYTEFREKTLAAGGLSQVTFTMKNGATLVMQNAEGAQPRELRAIADTVSQKYDKAVIIVTTDREGKRSFVVKTVGQLPNTNALEIAKMIAADLNGRAGGRPDFAQGGGEAKKPWQEFMSSLKETM